MNGNEPGLPWQRSDENPTGGGLARLLTQHALDRPPAAPSRQFVVLTPSGEVKQSGMTERAALAYARAYRLAGGQRLIVQERKC